MPFFKKGKNAPAEAFDEGWQFYAKATTLEPPGTVFRIDAARRRYLVGEIEVEMQRGGETVASLEKRVSTTLGMFARCLGLDKVGVGGNLNHVQQFAFDLKDAEREITTDLSLDQALAAFLVKLEYRADNRYFVIREAVSATAMEYVLTKAQLADLGGEAALQVAVDTRANVTRHAEERVSFPRTFPQRMRVTFLPEEITATRSSLSGSRPELGLKRVTAPLVWIDD